MAINTLDIPLLEISIFSFAVFGANMSISVATSLAIRQLLKQLGKTTKYITKFIERFVEFLVSINRMQDFLKCDEVSMREIEFINDDSIEFSQSLYLDFFNDKSKTNLSFEKAKQIVQDRYKSERISELFGELDSLDEFYKLRLVSVLQMHPKSPQKIVELQQNIACRYITVSGLDKVNTTLDDNMDFRGMKFYGKVIKAPFTLNS